jgi:hypothetical protein
MKEGRGLKSAPSFFHGGLIVRVKDRTYPEARTGEVERAGCVPVGLVMRVPPLRCGMTTRKAKAKADSLRE